MITKKDMMDEISEDLYLAILNKSFSIEDFLILKNNHKVEFIDIQNFHFLLKDEVILYANNLENNLRFFKDSNKCKKQVNRRGNIYGGNKYTGETIDIDFTCENSNGISEENIILKAVLDLTLGIIGKIKRLDLLSSFKIDLLRTERIIINLFRRNSSLRGLKVDLAEIPERMIYSVLKSKNRLYRESANILLIYLSIIKLNKEETISLFNGIFLELLETKKVFDLYCIFNYMNSLDKEKVKINTLANRDSKVFSYKIDNSSYNLYKSKNKYFDLASKIEVLDKDSIEAYRYREEKELIEFLEVKNKLKIRKQPDFLISKVNKSNHLEELSLGIIDYTNDSNKLAYLIKEALEYKYKIYENFNEKALKKDMRIKILLFSENMKLKEYKYKDMEIRNRGKI